MGLTSTTSVLERFASEVGDYGPVCCVGGRTQWDVGGPVSSGTREVTAPAGVVAHEPAEMILRVRAGTRLEDLSAVVGEGGQRVALEGAADATVGGVISVGRSGVRRLGWGPLRDAVLEVTAVSSRGELIRTGAPLVKNVTGFDLCRLLTGSLGTLAFVAEVVLRCLPLPEVERWYVAEGADPFEVYRKLYRPLSILWDGRRTWVGLAGFEVDVEEQARGTLGEMFSLVDGPPSLPGPGRRSLAPASLRSLPSVVADAGAWLAEVGVGVVHCDSPAGDRLRCEDGPSQSVVELHRRIKENFDPAGRLNPGRQVITGAFS
ncbi:MAG TPA: FAD-binding protein [Acidimicrobiales bacterium]